MGRKPTPPPESPNRDWNVDFGCSLFFLLPFMFLSLAFERLLEKVLLLFGIRRAQPPEFKTGRILGPVAMLILLPAVIVATPFHLLYGKFLLLLAFLKYRPRNIAGVFVTSNSPN